MSRTLQLHRWVVRLTKRHWRKDDLDGFIARRLLEGIPPTGENAEQFLSDLRHMIALAFEMTPEGDQYVSIRAQSAALNLRRLLNTHDSQTFIDRMNKERVA